MCQKLGLNSRQSCVLVNILFEVLRNGNPSYGVTTVTKSLENDYQLLQ
jgi:hypothetical protein